MPYRQLWDLGFISSIFMSQGLDVDILNVFWKLSPCPLKRFRANQNQIRLTHYIVLKGLGMFTNTYVLYTSDAIYMCTIYIQSNTKYILVHNRSCTFFHQGNNKLQTIDKTLVLQICRCASAKKGSLFCVVCFLEIWNVGTCTYVSSPCGSITFFTRR